jgi:hypothetical protein
VLVQDREVGEVALDALHEVVVLLLALDQRQLLLAPAPGAGTPRVGAEALGQPRPLRRNDDEDGGDEKTNRDPPHTPIVVLTLRRRRIPSDIGPMPWDVPLPFALLTFLAWAVVARAVLVYTQVLPPTCGECGLKLERRYLGESVCRCGR